MNSVSSIVPAANANAPLDDASKARLQKAVKDFEAIFVGYMLKSMRSGIPKSDMFGDSFGGDILDGMFDMEFAEQVSKYSNLGLGSSLYKNLTGEELPRTAHVTSEPVPPRPTGVPRTSRPHGSASASPGRSVRDRVEGYNDIIAKAAEAHGLDPGLIKAVMASESAGHADAWSSKNAKGLMQLIDSTAAAMGVKNVWDPKENISGGARYLRQMLDKFNGDVSLAVASYNAGAAAVEKHGGIPPYPETRGYVERVLQYWKAFGTNEGGAHGND